MAEPKRYHGEEIAVLFDASRCLHAAECVRGLPAVFDTRHRPWVLPDGAPADRVAEIVRRCPSGALHYERAGGPAEAPQTPTRVLARRGGPLWVRGDLEIQVGDAVLRETRAALCRCGQTANPPFCDGAGPCNDWREGEA
jgi:uncharacterized Fe-S cluster protein YjdI/CDGSH-type Zn-finger protein